MYTKCYVERDPVDPSLIPEAEKVRSNFLAAWGLPSVPRKTKKSLIAKSRGPAAVKSSARRPTARVI